MKKAKLIFKIVGLFALIGTISTIVLFLMWKQNEIIKRDGIRLPYLDDVTRFEVHYPYNWETAKGKVKQEDKKGICIYVNEDEKETIYCYYTDQPIELEKTDSDSTIFETTNGLKGNMFIKEENERKIIDLVFESQKYGIHIDVSKQNWQQNEDAIMKIMKSFIIIQ
ncbi:hypothetical protein [Cellulosilyticum lentocellum]|uniref:DUF4367 domain-containing protein n=1 Tax=Cellulosilyticum lentocellum (strain ATCC 49066 / DSM 5427 / NCIMB 11756 / RHM5) TaxID=642492 RepID=F2JGA0_CELLD|nr:hypothetical protein [Cellulosilyticum lentocellum]ADZ81795.1 hypothetical protein Clole_0033 [Cellulosilyticum lentocellum DSM 5427]